MVWFGFFVFVLFSCLSVFVTPGLLFTLFQDSSMRLWNIEEIDKIPLVSENKKAMGLKVRQVGIR